MVEAVTKQEERGYDAPLEMQSAFWFQGKYDAMDKNDDGKISKAALVEAIIQIGREYNFIRAPATKQHANVNGRPIVEYAILDDPNEVPVDAQTFRQGLSCLGKTFNNARHAYLKMDIAGKSLLTLKVRKLRTVTFSNH